MAAKKLYRSRRSKIVAGVAGGLGNYLNVDPIIFRILFIFLTFCGGSGAMLYLILMIIVPIEPFPFKNSNEKADDFSNEEVINDETATTTQTSDSMEEIVNSVKRQDKGALVGLTIGIILIVFGLYVLSAKILHIDWMKFIFPILLIGSGLVILISSMNSKNRSDA